MGRTLEVVSHIVHLYKFMFMFNVHMSHIISHLVLVIKKIFARTKAGTILD